MSELAGMDQMLSAKFRLVRDFLDEAIKAIEERQNVLIGLKGAIDNRDESAVRAAQRRLCGIESSIRDAQDLLK